MRTPIAALNALALLLVSCSGAGVAPPTPSPSANSPASVTFKFGSEPVVTRALAGEEDAFFVNPGAVIEQDGKLHMFANVFSQWPGHVDVPHLVSDDGARWTLTSDPQLSSDDIPLADPGADVSTGFVTDDGTWVLIFESVSAANPWQLGRMTARSPDGPWTVDPKPILTPGPAGSFDAGGLAWPSVVTTDVGYALYYTAWDRPRGNGVIGLATSTDGVAWTKADAPVIKADQAWELGSLDRPRVTATPRGIAMVYASGNDLTRHGVAWSTDGVSWAKPADGPALVAEAYPVDGRSWDAALLYRDGALHLWLEIGSGSGPDGTNVYQATAPLQ